LAAAIRIQARLEADIGTVVPRDDRLRRVTEELRIPPGLLLFIRRIDLNHIDIAQIDMKLFKSIGRIPGSAPSADRRRGWRRFLDDRNKLLFRLLGHLWHGL